MLIVGDSRVRVLEKVMKNPTCEGWTVECTYVPQAKLDRCITLLEDWKRDRFPECPRMVVIFSILCDGIKKVKRPDGCSTLIVSKSLNSGGNFPAFAGLRRKIIEVERLLRSWWGDLEIIWVHPFPVDVRRWTEGKLDRGVHLGEEEAYECHLVTYNLAKYLEKTYHIGTRVPRIGDRFVAWYNLWNDRRAGLNFNSFMDKLPKTKKFGWINHFRTSDGLHPSYNLARQLINLLYRKADALVPSASRVIVFHNKISMKKGTKDNDEVDGVVVDEEVVVDKYDVDVKIGKDESKREDLGGATPLQEPNIESRDLKSLKEYTNLQAMMKRVLEIDAIIESKSYSSSLDRVSSDMGVKGREIVVDQVGIGSEVSLETELYKTLYPCGHSLPFEEVLDFIIEKICPVCEVDWSDRNIVKKCFYVYEFQ